MAAKYLRHQFSIPHHLVPSFEDTAGVLAHEAADDTVNDDDDPLVPGAPVSSLRSNLWSESSFINIKCRSLMTF